ncbi:PH domain-containing protein [Actinomadura hibisca]|uniref:PH domain-containing protein n=1 Tax=Actinomadura hibisca TaxID=68565 RepID=UPI000A3E9499|nr:PH domain-containing protein [Actinomadura hibisca]
MPGYGTPNAPGRDAGMPHAGMPQGGPPQAAAPYPQDARYPADHAFAPGGGMPWAPISPRYVWQRRVTAVVWSVVAAAGGGLLMWFGGGTLSAILWVVALLLVAVLGWVVAQLAYRSYGYAERADDFIVTYGVFVKRLIVVPYGRMQFVDVSAGLLERWMGIATVRLHTAAAATDARVPGLPATEAALLRDRLAQKGEERSMGL